MISSLERLLWLLCKEKNWVRARPGMESTASQERGEEDLDCWWWSACSANGVVREGKEVKSDPSFLGWVMPGRWCQPQRQQMNMGQGADSCWGMVTIPHVSGKGRRPQSCKTGASLLDTMKTSVKTCLLPQDCGASYTILVIQAKHRPSENKRCQLL